jgi:hypothetical protein
MVPVPQAGPGVAGAAGHATKLTHALPRSFGNQLTPSFFCRLDDDVVYWNTSRLSG